MEALASLKGQPVRLIAIAWPPEGEARAWVDKNFAGVFEQLVFPETDPDTTSDGLTALYVAAFNGHNEIVQALIRNCATYEHVSVVAVLLDEGADCNLTRFDGTAALHIAAGSGCVETARLLLENHAAVDALSNDHVSPLFVAAQLGHTEMVQLLLKTRANPDMCASEGASGKTALFEAASEGHAAVVRELLESNAAVDVVTDDEHGASVDMATEDGATPLYVAAQNGNLEAVSALIAHSASVNLVMEDDATPLFIAAQNDHADVVSMLLAHGAEIDRAMDDGETPLGAANDLGETALLAAGNSGYFDVVIVLLDAGASADVCDSAVHEFKALWLSAADRLLQLRTIVIALHDFHIECSFVDRTAAFGQRNSAFCTSTFEEDQKKMLEMLWVSLHDDAALSAAKTKSAPRSGSFRRMNSTWTRESKDYVVPELAATLDDFFVKLERKCSTCSVSR
ncbi:hypothetical protein PybrP1_011927, partial [[Pythium] brassicae (nom. inval.)]